MNEQHEKTKKILKIIGLVLLVIGIPLMIAGFVSFFIGMNEFEEPRFFFLAFIGIPLTATGGALTLFAHHREINKYVKDESMPVIKETYKDLKPEIRDAVNTFKGHETEDQIYCKNCGTYNDIGDKFCKKCGSPLENNSKVKCPYCGAEIDTDATFCAKCGKKL